MQRHLGENGEYLADLRSVGTELWAEALYCVARNDGGLSEVATRIDIRSEEDLTRAGAALFGAITMLTEVLAVGLTVLDQIVVRHPVEAGQTVGGCQVLVL